MSEKNQTAVMCHNIAKYNREHRHPDLTPLEAAEILEDIAAVSDLKAVDGTRSGLVNLPKNDASSLRVIASYLRKIAAGEYKQVVHGHGIFVNNGKVERWCSRCNHIIPKYAVWCPFCGALMGKDDHNGNCTDKTD